MLRSVVEKTLVLLGTRLRACGNPPVATVYVGGGTPTLLPVELLRRLLGGIAATTRAPVKEWTVETNPENVDQAMLELLAACGVTRLSVGVQSFQPRLLRLLGRRSGIDAIEAAVSMIAGCWGGRWSVDLIGGILDQSVLEAVDDVERACGLGTHHISLYDLSVEPDTALERRIGRRAFAVCANRAAEVMRVAARVLQGRGYGRYEISNYARPGGECEHNLGYWTACDYIGVGPGAVSAVTQRDGSLVRYSDAADVGRFLATRTAWGRRERVGRTARTLERAMLGLRTAVGVTRTELCWGLEAGRQAAVRRLLSSWVEYGDAVCSGERVRMTPQGWDRLNCRLRELSAAIGLS